MSLLEICKIYATKIVTKRDPRFYYDVEKQKKYVKHFKEPEDDIERSYFQYKCQMQLLNYGLVVIYNIVSLLLIVMYSIKLVFKNKKNINSSIKCDAVFLCNDLPHNILPQELVDEYNHIIYSNNFDGFELKKEDWMFFFQLVKRYPMSWHFLFKCMMKISMYRFQVAKYNPQAVITYAEYSFTSSILTDYCELLGVLHINVMHGEKPYYMRDSFFRFNRFYVWDDFYIDLFVRLRAEKNQFIIAIPPSLKFEKQHIKIIANYDFKYYLAAENKEQIIIIAKILENLKKAGYLVAVRPHPRYSNRTVVNDIFKDIEIENPKQISIEKSICTTKNAIALFSTVLNQCYYNGIRVVIDDVSNYSFFLKLESLEYFMLRKPHKLLSDYIKDFKMENVYEKNN